MALWITLAAWLGDAGAGLWHQHAVVHVRCVEHDQIEEIEGATVARAPSEGLSLWGLDATAAHRACDDVAVPCDTTPARLRAPLAPIAHGTVVHRIVRLGTAPRAPPLAYAPKTSPPALG
jgi:hypothetical protein